MPIEIHCQGYRGINMGLKVFGNYFFCEFGVKVIETGR